ncbi:MAG TPA: hypothetical protein VFA50_10255 [Stellaceae bacterium]|nr:hypothetical protein [Stellaceae bacterium]
MVTYQEERKERAFEMAAVAPMTEVVAAIAIIVLAILGLANVAPGQMIAIATIIVGAALLLQGANTAGEYSRLLLTSPRGSGVGAAEFGGGVTIEFLAGGVGIVLGILSLLATDVLRLAPAALIVFGGALILSGGITARMATMASEPAAADPAVQAVFQQASAAAGGAQVLIGLAAMILGILAYVPINAGILLLVGLLAVGAALLMTSATVGGAVMSLFRS